MPIATLLATVNTVVSTILCTIYTLLWLRYEEPLYVLLSLVFYISARLSDDSSATRQVAQ